MKSLLKNPVKSTLIIIGCYALLTIALLDSLNGQKSYLATLLFIYNLLIIFSWLTLGLVAGNVLSILSALSVIFVSLSRSDSIYNLEIVSYLIISLIAYKFLEKEREESNLNNITLEITRENKNSLEEEHGKHLGKTDALKEKSRRFLILRKIAQDFSAALELEYIIPTIVEKTLSIIPSGENCQLFLVNEEKQELESVGFKSRSEQDILSHSEPTKFDSWVMRNRQALLISDPEKDFRFRFEPSREEQRKINSLIISPLTRERKVIGVFKVNSTEHEKFNTEDLRLLNIIGNLAAASIGNALLYQRTVHLAITDELTGLFVHRYFKGKMKEEVKKAEQEKTKLSLLMLDIDFFKNYNDQYGHITGDLVLKKVANILKDSIGQRGIVSRYGGEEFSIILPATNQREARIISEEIRKKVEEQIVVIRRIETRITISIGVATFPDNGNTAVEVTRISDNALLKAKREGRNRTCMS